MIYANGYANGAWGRRLAQSASAERAVLPKPSEGANPGSPPVFRLDQSGAPPALPGRQAEFDSFVIRLGNWMSDARRGSQ